MYSRCRPYLQTHSFVCAFYAERCIGKKEYDAEIYKYIRVFSRCSGGDLSGLHGNTFGIAFAKHNIRASPGTFKILRVSCLQP